MPDDGSFPALEALKEDAEGMETLIEAASPGIAGALEWLFDLDYAQRKRELLEERKAARRAYQQRRERIEQTYGSAVVRALDRREDGESPRFTVERMETELDDATAEIEALYDDLDDDFLTRVERRQLSALRSDIRDAREYVRNKAEFDRRRAELADDIERFEAAFDPYRGADRYMVTSDHDLLTSLSYDIWSALADLARELVLPILPDEDAAWLADRKTRFGELADYLPDYNEEFVAAERQRYADLFETEHGPLNDQQQRAVVRNDRRNLVDASAGTGKTLTLTYRFIYLLEKGVPAADIAAITYTSDAAEEMKTRIAAATDVEESKLNVMTIHAFALRIYRAAYGSGEADLGAAREELVERYHAAAQADRDPEAADVEFPDCYAAFKRGYDAFMRVEGNHGDEEEGYIDSHRRYMEPREAFVRRKLEEFVEQARTFDRSADDVRASLDGTSEVRDAFGEAGAALVEAYGRIVDREDAPTDFDDMIYTATDVVRADPDRYDHLLVDEFQDITDATLEFVEAFMGGDRDTRLFCVGDDWQSIYGFTGSNVRYFTEYEDRFEDVTYTELQVNYRCPPAIVRAGAEVMAHSAAPQNDKAVRAHSDHETTPRLHAIDPLYDARVVAYAADMVESELEDRSPEEVMVLSRNDAKSEYMEALREELESRSIPHRRPKGVDDYLPEEYRTSLPHGVAFDGQGFAEYDVPEGVDPPEEGPPLVRTQSIHSSKGTEAPVVVLLHAVDDDPDGIPSDQRTDEIIAPATDITADHIPEERRLFYVALTRTEEQFHAVARRGEVSRYVQDISGHFERTEVLLPEELVGRCTSFRHSGERNHPIKATLDCGDFELPLLSWPNQNPPPLEEGAVYRLRLTDPGRQIDRSEYGEEIRFDRTPIERVDDGGSASGGEADD
jgi:DNA helicase-4